jgi:hypothetical protein
VNPFCQIEYLSSDNGVGTPCGKPAECGGAGYRTAICEEPPAELTLALVGLWWDAKGDWKRAHESAQQDGRPRGFVGSRLSTSQRGRSGQRGLLAPRKQASPPARTCESWNE